MDLPPQRVDHQIAQVLRLHEFGIGPVLQHVTDDPRWIRDLEIDKHSSAVTRVPHGPLFPYPRLDPRRIANRDGHGLRRGEHPTPIDESVQLEVRGKLERLANIAYDQVVSGKVSPLYFHMYDRRMDLHTMAQATGLFKWRIKRHFKPMIFNKLSKKMLECYGDTLGISVEKLCTLPKRGEDSA